MKLEVVQHWGGGKKNELENENLAGAVVGTVIGAGSVDSSVASDSRRRSM